MERSSELSILQSKALSSAVKEEIVRLIMNGAISPGEKLGEADMAARLGVSRGPVREAFRSLEETGLVRLLKNRGVFVRDISPKEAAELYELRAGLDELAGKLLAPKITAREIEELRSLNEEMRRSVELDDVQRYFAQNIAFHDRIVEMIGNSKFLELYRRVMNETRLVRQYTIAQRGGTNTSIQEHKGIVEALATRDGAKAARVMHAHVMGGHTRLMQILATGEIGAVSARAS